MSLQAQVDTLWVLVAAILVLFMQAGFLLLEVGFSRAKNAGAVVAKVAANFAIASVCYWVVGFALAFGGAGALAGTHGFFLTDLSSMPLPAMSFSDAAPAAKFLFQLGFCAVALAIVWGTTLERIRYSAYLAYAIVFAAVIYPVTSHWVFGGGWLQGLGMQDFAGSTAVHLVGATGALAALLLLGPRRGKFRADGQPTPIPGHSMPLMGLGVFILWIGWFGFNAGSTLSVSDGRFAEVAIVTQLGAAGGVLGAMLACWLRHRSLDIAMTANGAVAGLVAITAPSGYVDFWAAPIIGLLGGVICVYGVVVIDRRLDDPVGALSAHGLAGVWGTLACGLFTTPALAEAAGVGSGGLLYTGEPGQLAVQVLGIGAVFAVVLSSSLASFWAIRRTLGLRIDPEAEEIGLDVSEHSLLAATTADEAGSPLPSPTPTVEPPIQIGAEAPWTIT
jgi:Amt family ammonium transporter